MSVQTTTQYRIVIDGDARTGKTTWVKKLKFGKFAERYIATIYINPYEINVKCDQGNFRLKFWDIGGTEKFRHCVGGYFIGADALISFSDSITEDASKIDLYLDAAGDTPVVKVLSKIDNLESDTVALAEKIDDLILISAKTGTNELAPIVECLSQITGEDITNLSIVI